MFLEDPAIVRREMSGTVEPPRVTTGADCSVIQVNSTRLVLMWPHDRPLGVSPALQPSVLPPAAAGGHRGFAGRGGVANSVAALAAHEPASAAYSEQAAPQLGVAGGVLSALSSSTGLYYWPAPALLRATSVVPPSMSVPSPLTSPGYQEQYSLAPAALWCLGKQQLRVKGAISVRLKKRAPPASAPAPRCSTKASAKLNSCNRPPLELGTHRSADRLITG